MPTKMERVFDVLKSVQGMIKNEFNAEEITEAIGKEEMKEASESLVYWSRLMFQSFHEGSGIQFLEPPENSERDNIYNKLHMLKHRSEILAFHSPLFHDEIERVEKEIEKYLDKLNQIAKQEGAE